MPKEWIAGKEGYNLKFKRETLLNYGMRNVNKNSTQVGKELFILNYEITQNKQ
jgi:hypothetical protein